jgi:AcrR family transcriptional regulator
MSASERPGPPSGRGFGSAFTPPARARRTLTQDVVVAAAIKILDAEGIDALTFRRLAKDLEVGVASLYWHVASKEVLLDLALDSAAAEVFASLPLLSSRTIVKEWPANWRLLTRGFAIAMYEELCRRPWTATQQLTSRDRGPYQMRLWDYLGRVMFGAGFNDTDAFYAMSAILSFVIGFAVQQAASASSPAAGDQRGPYLDAMGEFLGSLDDDEFPALKRIAHIFATHSERAQFEAGLDMMLGGIAAKLG